MADEASLWFEILKWTWGAISGVFIWIGNRWGSWRKTKRRRNQLVRLLLGLPVECKAILAEFYKQRTHTLRTDPFSPPMDVLIHMGIVVQGPSGGTYKAIDCYMTIAPDFWEVMDDWISAEDARLAFEKASDHLNKR